MSKQIQLRHLNSFPISWLSDGKLKTSILLRQKSAKTHRPEEVLRFLIEDRTPRAKGSSSQADLGQLEKDVLRRASDDYLRCMLAKSISEVYKNVTPKYRNEAARRQFFRRLVEIAEMIHLAESSSGFHTLLNPVEGDDVMIWVSAELHKLLEQQVDLAPEYVSKLNAARMEFRSSMRQLEGITGQTWQESERFHPGLSITSFFLPGVVESEGTWRWGSQWYNDPGVLNLNPPVLFLDVFRRGVVTREAAILLSPRILDSMEYGPRVLCEQSEYFSYKLLERKNDKELWTQARHGLRQQTRHRGQDLVDFFQYYEMMVGESLYQEVWLRLKEFGNARINVSDYYVIFNTLAARPLAQKFDKDEMRLLDLLSKRPDVKAGEAARLLRVSIPTAMKAIRDLSRKAGLRFTVIADMRRLGLVEYLLLLSTTKQVDVLRILSRFPYCRQVFRTYGSSDLFCVLDLPSEHAGFADEFVQAMAAKQLITRHLTLELERDFQAVNFASYDPIVGRWGIHWDSWGISLRESLSKSDTDDLEHAVEHPIFQFDKLDMKILSDIQTDCRTPFSVLGRSLGVSGAYVGKKISRMMRENVFRYAVWPLKIGAEDWGIVGLSCRKSVANCLAKYLSLLPAWRGGLVKGDFEGLLAIVWAPSGELKQLFKAIDDRLIKTNHAQAQCLNSIGEWIIARWLPVDPDDPWQLCTDDGKWLFDEKRFLALV